LAAPGSSRQRASDGLSQHLVALRQDEQHRPHRRLVRDQHRHGLVQRCAAQRRPHQKLGPDRPRRGHREDRQLQILVVWAEQPRWVLTHRHRLQSGRRWMAEITRTYHVEGVLAHHIRPPVNIRSWCVRLAQRLVLPRIGSTPELPQWFCMAVLLQIMRCWRVCHPFSTVEV